MCERCKSRTRRESDRCKGIDGRVGPAMARPVMRGSIRGGISSMVGGALVSIKAGGSSDGALGE